VAFEHAEEGSTFVFPPEYRKRAHGPGRWVNANLRTTFEKVIRRAGVDPWPRLWHSLRASCESDLAQSFPLANVTTWLGNTPSVALRDYVDPTEGAFERAATWVPESGAAAYRGKSRGVEREHRKRRRSGGLRHSVRLAARFWKFVQLRHGNRTYRDSSEKTALLEEGGAKIRRTSPRPPA
jgi:hypothetical protein